MSQKLKTENIPQRFLDALIPYCFSNHFIEKVILFGSRARGDCESASDIDLAILTNGPRIHNKI